MAIYPFQSRVQALYSFFLDLDRRVACECLPCAFNYDECTNRQASKARTGVLFFTLRAKRMLTRTFVRINKNRCWVQLIKNIGTYFSGYVIHLKTQVLVPFPSVPNLELHTSPLDEVKKLLFFLRLRIVRVRSIFITGSELSQIQFNFPMFSWAWLEKCILNRSKSFSRELSRGFSFSAVLLERDDTVF